MKVISVHHRLAAFTSHHFNEAHGFMEEFGRRGKQFVLLVSVRAPAQIVSELRAHPVLDDPTFRMEWSFEERSSRFVRMLHKTTDRHLGADDCVLVTTSTQLEAHALVRWLRDLPTRKKPWIVLLFLSDRWNRSESDEYERQMAEFRKLHAAISNLTSEDARRIILLTLTTSLAKELSGLLGSKVDVAPIPLPYENLFPSQTATLESHLPRIAILGGARPEKGSHLIPEIVQACRERVQVEFIVHLANNTLTSEALEELALVANEPNVTVIRQDMTLPEYNAAIGNADIMLFPYDVIPYRKRISGVFAEAVAFGKPAVATQGTWMAEQIESGRAAGTIFDDLRPDSIASAIARCVADLESLQRSAQALSSEWRRTMSLAAFVDLMEAQIAIRTQHRSSPARSRWWLR